MNFPPIKHSGIQNSKQVANEYTCCESGELHGFKEGFIFTQRLDVY